MKATYNRYGEFKGYESGDEEILVHEDEHFLGYWLVTIQSLDIYNRKILSKDCNIEQIKDKIYEILDGKEIVIENLKKLIAK